VLRRRGPNAVLGNAGEYLRNPVHEFAEKLRRVLVRNVLLRDPSCHQRLVLITGKIVFRRRDIRHDVARVDDARIIGVVSLVLPVGDPETHGASARGPDRSCQPVQAK
jgi:hypothetical protein